MSMSTLAARSTPAIPSLRPRPDQPQNWRAYSQPIPFSDAARVVLGEHARDGERSDVTATDLRTWAFGSVDQDAMHLTRVPLPGRDHGSPVALRELAFAQLCQRIGTPAAYVRTLPTKLQIACMNWGLAQEPQNALLRLAGGEVRAIMSERYAAIDDAFLLELVDDVISRAGYRDDAVVRAVATGPHTVLRITVPSGAEAVQRGDVIEYGLDIANSELGLRSVQVTPITHRLICTNGMRAWRSEAALRMRHIGDPARLRDQLRDAVPVALAEARGDIDRWRRATEILIDNALEEIEDLRAYGLSGPEVQAIGRSLAGATGLLPADSSAESLSSALRTSTSAFELANAITATARDRTDVAARLQLESLGHRYLVSKTDG